MATLFSDTFESGDLSNWTGTNGTIAASGAAAHAGSFGCDANSSDAFAFKDFSAPASQFVSHRADVKLLTASGAGVFRILQISQGATSIAKILYDNGTYKLELRNADNSLQTATIAGITTNTWQELRLDYDWSPGQAFIARAYVDGAQAAELTDATPAGGTIWQATRVFLLTFEDAGPTNAHAYFDAVSVEDTAPASGATYTEAGQALAVAVASAADSLTMAEAGQATSSAAAGGLDVFTAADAGGALAAWSSGALDTHTMVDAGGGVLVASAGALDSVPGLIGGTQVARVGARGRTMALAARRRTERVA